MGTRGFTDEQVLRFQVTSFRNLVPDAVGSLVRYPLVIEKPKQLPLSMDEASLVADSTKPPSAPDKVQHGRSTVQAASGDGPKDRTKNERKKRKKRKRG